MNVTISHIKLHFFQFMAYCLKDSRGLQAVRSLVYSMLDVPLPLESTRHSGLNHKSIHCELRWVDDLQGFLRPQDGRLKGPHSVALTNKNPHQMIIHRQIRGQSPALPCCQRKNTDRVRKTKKRNDRAKALHSWVRKRKGDVIVMGGEGGVMAAAPQGSAYVIWQRTSMGEKWTPDFCDGVQHIHQGEEALKQALVHSHDTTTPQDTTQTLTCSICSSSTPYWHGWWEKHQTKCRMSMKYIYASPKTRMPF